MYGCHLCYVLKKFYRIRPKNKLSRPNKIIASYPLLLINKINKFYFVGIWHIVQNVITQLIMQICIQIVICCISFVVVFVTFPTQYNCQFAQIINIIMPTIYGIILCVFYCINAEFVGNTEILPKCCLWLLAFYLAIKSIKILWCVNVHINKN